MKTLLLSTGLAFGLGVFALAPASAAPVVKSTVVTTGVVSDSACRMVEKRVRRNGVVRITRTRECTRPRVVERRVYRDNRRYAPRPYYRPDPRPGISIRVN
ncbi:hypothetical protein [Methylopila turkensis]|uniref:Uncharacterized protein n=1 Tax=Methylopila turkensis TaxID=1437816 RepID=A0A9W6JKT8_9HYPH|nr:hypothetical protein [Methylopila turkensis]GLK79486.1 hypothetical protein GCM10008174_12270 [Methylopila turkensis]